MRSKRRSWGLTCAQLASGVGLSGATLSRFERGLHPARPKTAHKLADAYGVSVSALVVTEDSGDSLPDRMRQRRLAAGWGQVKLARKAGVHKMTVCRFERGSRMGAQALDRLLAAYDSLPEVEA